MKPSLGRLTRVDLRTAWAKEDSDFTPWLAKEENLRLLGDTLGLELELEAQEHVIGPFRADLLCKDTADRSWVLIENQIERTDHTHLGQVITYAAGSDAVTIIWIAARFTEEHRAAIDWLNDISHERIRFFGLEVELWQIGDSPIAPKFNIVAKPNDWSRSVREATAARTGTERQRTRYEFWSTFCAYLDEQGSRLSGRRTPSREYWMSWAIGRSGFLLDGLVGFRDGWIGIALTISSHPHFHLLERQRQEVEMEVSDALLWEFEPSRKASYVKLRKENVDPMDRDQWPQLHAWLRDKLELFEQVFRPRVAVLDAADWTDDEDTEAAGR